MFVSFFFLDNRDFAILEPALFFAAYAKIDRGIQLAVKKTLRLCGHLFRNGTITNSYAGSVEQAWFAEQQRR